MFWRRGRVGSVRDDANEAVSCGMLVWVYITG